MTQAVLAELDAARELTKESIVSMQYSPADEPAAKGACQFIKSFLGKVQDNALFPYDMGEDE